MAEGNSVTPLEHDDLGISPPELEDMPESSASDLGMPLPQLEDVSKSSSSDLGMSPPEIQSSASKDTPQGDGAEVKVIKVITVVLAGKCGAGKSTLMRNLFDIEEEMIELSPGHLTKDPCETSNTKHGITIRVVDTVGLQTNKAENRRELEKLSRYTEGKADILVYCLSVSCAAKFDGNPDIMELLQKAFGKKIWQHCLVVLTFSNDVIDRCKKKMKRSTTEEINSKYIQHLQQNVAMFNDELKKLKVKNVMVRLMIDCQLKPTPQDTLAIPAGDDLDDKVLPGLAEGTTIPITVGDQQIQIPIENWKDVIFTEIIKKSDGEHQKSLLQYRYGVEGLAKALSVGIILLAVLLL